MLGRVRVRAEVLGLEFAARLVLDRGIPPRVEKVDARRGGEVEANAARLEQ